MRQASHASKSRLTRTPCKAQGERQRHCSKCSGESCEGLQFSDPTRVLVPFVYLPCEEASRIASQLRQTEEEQARRHVDAGCVIGL